MGVSLVPYSRASAKKNKKYHAGILGGSGEEVRGQKSDVNPEPEALFTGL